MSVTIMKQAAKAKSASAKKSSEAKTGVKPDVLHSIALEVKSLSQAKAFDLADELIESRGRNAYKLGGVLAVIHDNCKTEGKSEEWLQGHDTFQELCEKRLDFSSQTGMDLIRMYKHLVDRNIPGSIVEEIGWTKVYHLAVAGKPETAKDAASWIEKVKEEKLTVTQLKSLLKDGETSTKKSWLNLPAHEDQKPAINKALEKAMEEMGTKSKAVALHGMSQAYLGNAVTMEFKCPHCGKSATSAK